ncbi:LOW QUALITY PROTEIN: sister chromatid cohesion protein PDS5 homolog B [Drosophila sulfurigaster albostrigata]|uniref:LOW QUALITY PROTEIN: sister chromatid cohesion protein PDS5 homolog B n=1 Tax=Drosophila sulfurigaster albostrigata TaxID=89887 RepID=UPI002D21EBFF|nr:LOW QUALITY PROTEIN: sister chromatid cohesion protein PDS5 homolog B [Drosophila sulfurigaster albostrigata]
MADIVYPNGCRPLVEDLGTDELIRRLKTLANVLQTMDQDDNLHQQYIPLALHLLDDFFMQHQSRDVQLLIACCIADVLRVYAPEAPYKEQDQIKAIFKFFIKQLHGLKDPRDPSFKRYFYLLENLAFVKSFNMCFELEDCQEIFYELFSTVFKIINDQHSVKVKNFFLDVLSPLITEADNLSVELLDLILINIVEPNKSTNKYAHELTEQLLVKTGDAFEATIKLFFNRSLVMDKPNSKLSITSKIYDIIYELNQINSDLLCSVLPQLENKLLSTDDAERLRATTLLARMFSEKDSQLSKKYPSLLRVFFGRFCDITEPVRVKCVQSSMHFLLNHPHLQPEITEKLRVRHHDLDELVRHEVVMAIVETAKRNFEIVVKSPELLEIVRERTMDKKYKIRRDAMNGLGYIYRRAICEPNDLSPDVKQQVEWIKNKIMHGYYKVCLEDKLMVERLLITCLVPYKLAPEERMKKLYHLLSDLDTNATKAFVELQKNQMKSRHTVSDWIKLHHSKEFTPRVLSQLAAKQSTIAKLLPEPLKANEYITQFSQHLRKDAQLLRCVNIVLKRDVSCRECADTMSVLLKKLGAHIMTNLYYNTVKMLIERVASVMVDKESIGVLISLIEQCIQGGDICNEIGISPDEAGERGLKLLSMLSYVFSAHFFTDTSLRHLIALLSYDHEYVAPLVLKTLTHLGRYQPLIDDANPAILSELAPICKDFALMGTPKQAKHAVRCIFVNSQSSSTATTDGGGSASTTTQTVHPIFNEIIEELRQKLAPNCEYHRTKIVTLGHIAFNMPQAFLTPIKNMIARRIVKELLIQEVPAQRDIELPESDWCDQDELPPDTLCKLDALKTMARWLLGLRSDEHAAQKTFRMLAAFVNQRGDLLAQNRLCGAEKSWLRLGAACAMLKVCEQKGVGDQYSAEQYLHLSQLMQDQVLEVREIFARKLHKGLGRSLPRNCLPLDFMGFYVLSGMETNRKLQEQVRHYVEADVNKRREYLKTVAMTSPDSSTESQSLHILPDYMLAFAIPVLVHDPNYTNHEDYVQLRKMEKCLRFIIEPLMAKRESFVYSFYKQLLHLIKHHEYSQSSEKDRMQNNHKMWALCDLSMHIIDAKVGQFDGNSSAFSMPLALPEMYYKLPSVANFQNNEIYIPLDVYTLGAKSSKASASTTTALSHASAANSKRTADLAMMDDENSLENNLFDNIRAADTTEPMAKRTRGGAATAPKS